MTNKVNNSNTNTDSAKNVLVYAISNRSGGGYSVLEDFFQDTVRLSKADNKIKWIYALSTQQLCESQGVKILNYPWVLGGLIHRLFFNVFIIKKLIKEYKIDYIVSLQNASVVGARIPTIISFHNVLPLYKCDDKILDSGILRIKQRILNKMIIRSVKNARATIIPGNWIKERFVEDFGIDRSRLYVSHFRLPKKEAEIKRDADLVDKLNVKILFFYPASAFPYKNHEVIVKACYELKKRGVTDYRVLFTIKPDGGRTAAVLFNDAKLLDGNIELCGPIQRDTVMDLYRNAVLLFPSKIEADALPLIECKSVGGYMISSDLPFAREAIQDYQGALFFEPDDYMGLARMMEKIIKDGVPDYTVADNSMNEGDSRAEIVSSIVLGNEQFEDAVL